MADERVLVVDDSLVYQDLVVNHVLKPNGYRPLSARDGASGLSMALQEKPDLIILDLRMPGLSGIQVLQALREQGCDIPAILMTLHGSEDLAVQAFRLGVKDYVIKPFDVEELLGAMGRALVEVRLRRERDALTCQLIQANQSLESEHRKLEAVLANTEDAIILVEEASPERIMLANHAARCTFGLGGPAAGQPLDEAVSDLVLADAFQRAQASGQAAHAELTLADGRILNAHVTPIPGVGRVAVMQDITHLKELDRMKSEFVSAVSHDLRSPLTSIKGFADLLPSVGPLTEQQRYFVGKIQHGVEAITGLVTDLLDLSRIEAEVNQEMELCDLASIVEKAIARQQNDAYLKQQTLQLQLTPGLPPVLGNPPRLGQVVSNLVSNAIKYTQDGGHISVSVGREDGQLVTTVEDDGMGIPTDALAHIFDKFYRVKREETEGIPGTGLGLSIVKTIVEKHQGRIWVHSQVGEGTAFTFILPAATPLPFGNYQDERRVPALR